MKKLQSYFKNLIISNSPRWLVLGLDTLIALMAFYFSMFILYNLNENSIKFSDFYLPSLVVVLFRLQGFLLTRSYRGVIKYTSTQDAVRISLAVMISSFGIFVANFIYEFYTEQRLIPLSLQIIDFFILISGLTSVRILVKILYQLIKNQSITTENVVIFGAGESGMITKRAIDSNVNLHYRVVAFFDDDPQLQNKTIEGVKIHDCEKGFDKVIEKLRPSIIIISARTITAERLKTIVNRSLAANLQIKRSPASEKWVNGEFQFNQIERVKIEDLLGRTPIALNHDHIGQFIQGKRILITGAAGSIGSELVRQCLKFKPEKVIMLDQAETPLHDMQLEMAEQGNVAIAVGDVCNNLRMNRVFEHFRPEVVFHAAAYKHVPLMEDNPYEAINNNVFGTRVVANLAVEYKLDKFVLISTDKAVNPTNIMGASKRIAEIYVQSLNHKLSLSNQSHCRFITTRFGNVLGSNGSVIPLFKKQIENGGPITVTHPDITRYFMTIPEACQLVLEAGSMGIGGEIFIFDMGESVRISDLAHRMIELSGLTPGEDIKIEYTGLRPGEKLKEELLSDKENTVGTYNPKIMIANVREYDYLEVNRNIDFMYENKNMLDNQVLVSMMKNMVPEYVSNNSVYQSLDKSPKTFHKVQ